MNDMQLIENENPLVKELYSEGSIEGKIVVIEPKFFKPEYRTAKFQLVLATGGFGCSPTASGNAVFAHELVQDNPEDYRVERYNLLGLATPELIEQWKEAFGELNDYAKEHLEVKA